MHRRDFNRLFGGVFGGLGSGLSTGRLCSGLLAGAASASTSAIANTQFFPKSALFYDNDDPVTVESLAPGTSCVFSYPFVTTPCFVVRLKSSAAQTEQWAGGVGDDQSVVAFSAICSHKMSHPAKPISHINFRSEPVTFYDKDGQKHEREQMISCCSERSVYDPTEGAAVLSGPAPVPLAAIALEVTDAGQLLAVGSSGIDQYDRFLEKFGFRLAMEYGVTDVRARVGEQTVATLAEQFSSQQIRC